MTKLFKSIKKSAKRFLQKKGKHLTQLITGKQQMPLVKAWKKSPIQNTKNKFKNLNQKKQLARFLNGNYKACNYVKVFQLQHLKAIQVVIISQHKKNKMIEYSVSSVPVSLTNKQQNAIQHFANKNKRKRLKKESEYQFSDI